VHSDFFGAGEHNSVDAAVIDQLLPGASAAAGDEVEHAGRNARFCRDLVKPVAEERSRGSWFEDDRVARHQRPARRSCGQSKWKIERRDDGPHAVGAHHARVLFVRSKSAESRAEAVMLLDLVAVIFDEIRRLFNIAHTFQPVLAGLVTHERGQLPTMSAYSVGDFLEQHHAFAPWSAAPAWECRSGGGDRPLNVLATSLLELAQQDPRVDRTSVVELTGRFDRLPSDHHRIALAKTCPDLFDRVVQLAVQILHPLRAHRGVRDFRIHGFLKCSKVDKLSNGSLMKRVTGATCRNVSTTPR
jgi:hypothetical protein